MPRKILSLIFDAVLVFAGLCSNLIRYRSLRVNPPLGQVRCSSRDGTKDLFVLGNGPSLAVDLDKVPNDAQMDVVVVNKFGSTELFARLKPKLYLLPDVKFWGGECSAENLNDQVLILNALEKVDWPLTLVLPVDAQDSVYSRELKNENVQICYIRLNAVPTKNIKLAAWLLRAGFFTPNPINSLVLAIWVGVKTGYEKIYVIGADYDFFKGLTVDQTTNQVGYAIDHFYGVDKSHRSLDSRIDSSSKPMHTRLEQASIAFHQLMVLAYVGRNIGTKIINQSSYSLIDAFERG